ncbi:hypothetical protein PflQ2_2735 [Pseudomonas fluorescens Q2-87]|uniref:Uncharacterized protein n=1 Tax=Pseudomonas fluorescens (strain Q2-87) TaxID=1038922 RepID=J2EED6_PSEFQ|nr:hypothetical protein PflQ2_2735 [Pseudomonas fluorescens Q2-87]
MDAFARQRCAVFADPGGTLNGIVAEQVTVPTENENLIVVREPQAPAKNGAYHVQLMKDLAAIGYNGELGTEDSLMGMYVKRQ